MLHYETEKFNWSGKISQFWHFMLGQIGVNLVKSVQGSCASAALTIAHFSEPIMPIYKLYQYINW